MEFLKLCYVLTLILIQKYIGIIIIKKLIS